MGKQLEQFQEVELVSHDKDLKLPKKYFLRQMLMTAEGGREGEGEKEERREEDRGQGKGKGKRMRLTTSTDDKK
jgi:hypothetical protein